MFPSVPGNAPKRRILPKAKVSGPVHDGVFRDAVLSILAMIAKQERIRLSERTVAGMERARKSGAAIGRPKENAA